MRAFLVFLTATGFSFTTAVAQEATEQLEEVIVNAQKIEQRLIDVPISMTVLGSDELESTRVQGLKDYVFKLPNVTFTQGARGDGVNIVIRGISGQGGNFSTTTSTIDGLSYNLTYNNQVMSLRSFDTESIEVLRGPQGTMGGALALGGLINMVTVKPSTNGTSGQITADYGRFDTRLLKGSYNLPLGETVAVRGSAFIEESDGAVKNRGPAGGSSSTDNAGGRLALRWAPTDALTIDLAGTYDKQDYGINDQLYIDQQSDGPNETSEERVGRVALLESLGGAYENPRAPFWGEGADSNGGYWLADSPDRDQFRTRLYSLHANYRMGSHQADLLYGTYDYDRISDADNDRSQFGYVAGRSTMDITTDTAELRFSSKYEGALNWVAGAAWQRESFGADSVSFISDLGLALNAGETEGLQDLAQEMTYLDFVYREGGVVKSRALFANVFYDFAERWHLSVGARYTKTSVGGYIDCCGDVEPGTLIDGRSRQEMLLLLPQSPRQTTESISDLNPRVALNYDVRENVSAYVQFGTGFRPAIGNDPRAVEFDLADPVAKSEFVKNYEVGIKGAFLDRRLSLAAAAFYMDYTDLQVFQFIAIDPFEIEYLINAGSAAAMGFEVEAALELTNGLELRGAVGYTDSEISELQVDAETVLRDQKIPGVRPWTTSLAALYERPVTQSLKAGFRADYSWQAKPQATDREFGWETLDLSADLAANNWVASVYLENAFNHNTRTGLTYGGLVPSVFFVPRTYGLRFTYKFRE